MEWTAPTRHQCATLVLLEQQTSQRGPSMEKAIMIGLDIAKNVFEVHGRNASGEVVLRRRLKALDDENSTRALRLELSGARELSGKATA